MTNVNKLKGKIVECGLKIPEVAKKIGMDVSTFYRKLNQGGETFTVAEVMAIADVLKLSYYDINAIFFNLDVA